MDAGLGFAKFCEDRSGTVAHTRRELGFLQDFKNRAERTMLRLIFCLHLNVGCGHAVLPNFFGRKSPARDPQAAQFSAKLFHVTASID